jgi:hypothetical protein
VLDSLVMDTPQTPSLSLVVTMLQDIQLKLTDSELFQGEVRSMMRRLDGIESAQEEILGRLAMLSEASDGRREESLPLGGQLVHVVSADTSEASQDMHDKAAPSTSSGDGISVGGGALGMDARQPLCFRRRSNASPSLTSLFALNATANYEDIKQRHGVATSALLAIVGHEQTVVSDYSEMKWDLVHSGQSSLVWRAGSASSSDRVLIKGSFSSSLSVEDTCAWLQRRHYSSALKGRVA